MVRNTSEVRLIIKMVLTLLTQSFFFFTSMETMTIQPEMPEQNVSTILCIDSPSL